MIRPVFIVLIAVLFGCQGLYASVAFSPMRGLTKKQFVWDMKVGWNLGNTMDASTETAWGNPVTTQAMIDAVHVMGFKTMREPVTWKGHFGGAPAYTIDAAWLARVVTIANYALNDSMYVIVNTHHDGTTGGWYNLAATGAEATAIAAEVAAIWTQIANAFRNYGDYVVFEIFNEPQNGAANPYNGGDATSRANLAAYQLAAVNAIRATGGNNATRMIMVQGISASPIAVSVGTIPVPDSNTLISIHTYDPNGFSMNANPTTWGTSADSASIRTNLLSIQNMVAAKGGTAVIGEWGSGAKDDLASRVRHACYYAQQVRLKGMVPVWWDNGSNTTANGDGFALLNRTANPPSWYFPTVAQALCNCASNVPAGALEPPKAKKIPRYGIAVKGGILSYALPGAGFVSLRVYTLQGNIAATLVNSVQTAGSHEVNLSARGLSSGSYLLDFKAGRSSIIKAIAWSAGKKL